MKCVLLATLSIAYCIDTSFAQILTSELEGKSAEEIANKTYVEEQSELQKFLFKNYNRKLRPMRNQSLAIQVGMHIYVMHYTVNQYEQTITLNGHIYMTWEDEMAVWDPASFNNVRTTIAKQWDLWQPDLRVANSVSGVNQYFDISKRSHTTLTSITPTRTKVEVYPTFAVKIGCHFDYSDYPFDVQNCAMRLYTTQLMNEVEMHIYYDLNPSVLLGWGEQAAKRHISDWELLSMSANLSYYTSYTKSTNKQFVSERPSSAEETQYTWALVLVWIELRRNASLFWVELALPLFVATLLNVGSFVVVRPEHAVFVILINFFFQNVCLGDTAVRALPPVVGDMPRVVRYANSLLIMTSLALALHIVSLKFIGTQRKIPPRYIRHMRPILRLLTPNLIKSTKCAESAPFNGGEPSESGAQLNAVVTDHTPSVERSADTYARFRVADALDGDEADDCCANELNTIHLVVFRNLCAFFYALLAICVALVIFIF